MRKCCNLVIFAWVATATAVNTSTAAPAGDLEKQYVQKIEELLPGMGAVKLEDRKDSQLALEKMCFEASAPGKEAERAALSRAIMGKVGTDADTAKPARVWMLRKIEPMGRDEVVADLTALFRDEDAQVRELARRALENNPSPGAAASLRAELAQATSDAWRVALINALGFRRDAESVETFARLAGDKSDDVAAAAIAALAKIADDRSIDVLTGLQKTARPPLQDEVTDACLRGAEGLAKRGATDRAVSIYTSFLNTSSPERIRLAAMNGLVAAQGTDALPKLLELMGGGDPRMQLAAARCAQDMPGPAVTNRLRDALADATPAGKAVLLDVLGQRGDRSAVVNAVGELDSGDEDVRIAALEALGRLGDRSHVSLLAERAAKSSGLEQAAARAALAHLSGQGVDETIVAGMKAGQAPVRAELIRAAADRRIESAKPIFLAVVEENDETLRVAGITALAACATDDDLPRLLALLGKARSIVGGLSDPALKTDAAGALVTIAVRTCGHDQATSVAALEDLEGAVADKAVRARIDGALDVLTSYCVSWLVSGPYGKDGTQGSDLIDVPFPPEQATAKPGWKPLAVTDARQPRQFDLGKQQNCCAYVKTRVWSDKEQPAQLALGTDDGVKVWLNGKVVHSNNASRGVQCDQDKVAVTLKQGWNPLMLKITQGGGDWGFCCAIRAPQGGRLKGLKFEAQ